MGISWLPRSYQSRYLDRILLNTRRRQDRFLKRPSKRELRSRDSLNAKIYRPFRPDVVEVHVWGRQRRRIGGPVLAGKLP